MIKITLIISLLTIVRSEVAVDGQCGGLGYTGDTVCDASSTCVVQSTWYSQCKAKPNDPNKLNEFAQCGGLNFYTSKICQTWLACVVVDPYYHQCQKTPQSLLAATTTTSTIRPTTTTTTTIRPITTTTTLAPTTTTTTNRPTTTTTTNRPTTTTTTTLSPATTTTIATGQVFAKEWEICSATIPCYLGLTCVPQSGYSQCIRYSDPTKVNQYEKCGGIGYTGPTECALVLIFVKINYWNWQCEAYYN